MDQHERVVVHVHHPAIGRDGLRDLVGAAGRGQAGPDVEELADAALTSQVAHHPGQERPVRTGSRDHLRAAADDFLGGLPVSREMVLAAEPVRIHPGRVRHRRIEARGRAQRAGGQTSTPAGRREVQRGLSQVRLYGGGGRAVLAGGGWRSFAVTGHGLHRMTLLVAVKRASCWARAVHDVPWTERSTVVIFVEMAARSSADRSAAATATKNTTTHPRAGRRSTRSASSGLSGLATLICGWLAMCNTG